MHHKDSRIATSALASPKDEVTFQPAQKSNMHALADMTPYWESQPAGSMFSPVPVHLSARPRGPALLPSQSEKWQGHSAELKLQLPLTTAVHGGCIGIQGEHN